MEMFLLDQVLFEALDYTIKLTICVCRKQVTLLFKLFGGTIAWSLFQWFFASGPGCGFKFFPTFGLEAYKHGYAIRHAWMEFIS